MYAAIRANALALAISFAAMPLTGLADTLAAPAGDVVLTVNGDIATTNQGDTAVFDMDMLMALPVTEFTTTTIWTEGEQTFEGVSLHHLLEVLGVSGGDLKATAINDYAVDIPVSDAVEGGPILAYRQNGAEMSVRDKGPLWVVYPYDTNADYRSEVVYARSIWQMDRLTVSE